MGDLSISNIFLYFSLALILLWTVRLARSKGKNPFLWGGIAFLLMLIPDWSALLSMGPMIVLLFLKAPQKPAEETVQETITCPKCRAYHALGHTYCVNCGWELNRPYTEASGQATEANAPSKLQIEQTVGPPPAETVERVASVDSPTVGPVSETVHVEDISTDETKAEGAEEAPVTGPQQAVVSRPVTPERFTQQGLERLGERHFQEAIDQFNKALALDPCYIPALENRAEAYLRQGREDRAAEDRQLLEALQRESASK